MLPLVDAAPGTHSPGWCTYADDFDGLPDLEYFCGGINDKTPTAAALWRQGNLLHFGFEQSPFEMNAVGRALLLNAIAYISRFTEDRPIALTPSVFAGPAPRWRGSVAKMIRLESRELKDLEHYLAPPLFAALKGKDRAACQAWFDGAAAYLYPEQDGRLGIDQEAQSFGSPPNTTEFLARAIASLPASGADAARARRLLTRYVPEGPGAAPADAWEAWLKENRPFLFFSEAGNYRWYTDPLAKKRGIPTAELRGPARATLP